MITKEESKKRFLKRHECIGMEIWTYILTVQGNNIYSRTIYNDDTVGMYRVALQIEHNALLERSDPYCNQESPTDSQYRDAFLQVLFGGQLYTHESFLRNGQYKKEHRITQILLPSDVKNALKKVLPEDLLLDLEAVLQEPTEEEIMLHNKKVEEFAESLKYEYLESIGTDVTEEKK